jgi:hypothetical protein
MLKQHRETAGDSALGYKPARNFGVVGKRPMLRPGDAYRLDLLATLPAQDADETASASGNDRASATPSPDNGKRRGIQVLRGCSAARDEFLEHAPLLVPIDPADNGPQVSLVEALQVWKEKDLLLNIRSEVEQLHDLGHPGPRHPA